MNKSRQFAGRSVMLIGILLVAGCASPKETTAPCKRPANLLSYGPVEGAGQQCGPMLPVNRSAQDALDELARTETPDGM